MAFKVHQVWDPKEKSVSKDGMECKDFKVWLDVKVRTVLECKVQSDSRDGKVLLGAKELSGIKAFKEERVLSELKE